MLNGEGTFQTMEEVNGQKLSSTRPSRSPTEKTKSIEKTITVNDDGSKTITKTGGDGRRLSTIQETKQRIPTVRGTTDTRDKTERKWKHDLEVSRTDDRTRARPVGIDHLITRTNASGQTETLDRAVTKADGSRTAVTTGTGYSGNPIYNEKTWTSLTA